MVPNTCNLHVAGYCSRVAFARSHISKHYQCRLRRICLPRVFLYMHHCFDFRSQNHHSRAKIYRCHAQSRHDHSNVPLIGKHLHSMEKFLSPDNRLYCPGLACLDGSVHVQVRIHTSHNTCSTKYKSCKRLHGCTSAHGLHTTSRFPQI